MCKTTEYRSEVLEIQHPFPPMYVYYVLYYFVFHIYIGLTVAV
jgi:hypothetical protein